MLQNIFVCICLKQPRFCRSWICKRIQQISLVLLVITTFEKYYFIVLFQCMPLQGQGVFSVKFSLIFQAHSFLWLQGWRFCTHVSYVAIGYWRNNFSASELSWIREEIHSDWGLPSLVMCFAAQIAREGIGRKLCKMSTGNSNAMKTLLPWEH